MSSAQRDRGGSTVGAERAIDRHVISSGQFDRGTRSVGGHRGIDEQVIFSPQLEGCRGNPGNRG